MKGKEEAGGSSGPQKSLGSLRQDTHFPQYMSWRLKPLFNMKRKGSSKVWAT
jgi:hypothetical protein